MSKRLLLIQGHPDGSEPHLCHALAASYAEGAALGGHLLRELRLSELDVPLLRSQKDWEHGAVPPSLKGAQDDIAWAEHLLLVFPLWLGDMPALLKAFLEQVARPGFAFTREEGGSPWGKKALGGRSARVVVTMGMPAIVYKWFFRAHSLKSLERNILGFVGIAPVHETLVGLTAGMKPAEVSQWQERMRRLGEKAG